jgi:hypothetical protein
MNRAILVGVCAVMVAACGASTPTSTEVKLSPSQGKGLAAQDSSACPAQSISLSYTPRDGRHVMTVVFQDARSNDVAPIDCPALAWSVTPQAQIQPLFDGSRTIIQAELIVAGPPQAYTVTAASGAMTDSLQITAGR